MNTRSMLIVGLLGAMSAVASETEGTGFFEDSQRGWYWRETQEEPVEEKKAPEAAASVAPAAPPLTPRELLKKQGEDWEDALAEAILTRSPEAYRNYLAKTEQITRQSQEFATGFKQAIWTSPEFDYTLQAPRDTQAIVALNQQKTADHDAELRSVAEKNGLIFFFRGDCPFCHRFAPVLQRFAAAYGFSVVPVSLDGGALPEYPYPKKNHHLGARLKVETVPALFMVNPEKNAVATVGYGYADYTKLTAKVLYAGKAIRGELQQAAGGY